MAPKNATSTPKSALRKPDESDEDISRPPDSSGTSSDEDVRARAANIMPTNFGKRASEEPDTASSRNKRARRAKLGQVTATRPRTEGNRSSPRKRRIISSQDSDFSSPKQKSQELGAGMVDTFGRVQHKKPKSTPTYRSSQSSQGGTSVYRSKSNKDVVLALKSSSMPESALACK